MGLRKVESGRWAFPRCSMIEPIRTPQEQRGKPTFPTFPTEPCGRAGASPPSRLNLAGERGQAHLP